MTMPRLVQALAAVGGVLAATLVVAPSATAQAPPFVPVVSGLASPTHLAFGPGDSIYVADAFVGQVVKVDLRSGAARTLVTAGPGTAVAGVDTRGNGSVFYTAVESGATPADQGPAWLDRTNAAGRAFPHVADLLAVERTENPDGQNPNAPDAQSNPYSVLALPGRAIVADAAGNSLVEVRADGSTRVLTAFPNITTGLCADVVNNDPAHPGCDAVPTDVEMGPDGFLYVSGLGAERSGHIYKVDATSGQIVQTWEAPMVSVSLQAEDGSTVSATIPAPLTGIDVADDGTLYVSSVIAGFGGADATVWRIRGGSVSAAFVPVPTDIEERAGTILVASFAGSVFSLSPSAFGA